MNTSGWSPYGHTMDIIPEEDVPAGWEIVRIDHEQGVMHVRKIVQEEQDAEGDEPR